jgi:hypothetical protein
VARQAVLDVTPRFTLSASTPISSLLQLELLLAVWKPKTIEERTGQTGVIQVRTPDMDTFAGVKKFVNSLK